jgi:hypothetical protein
MQSFFRPIEALVFLIIIFFAIKSHNLLLYLRRNGVKDFVTKINDAMDNFYSSKMFLFFNFRGPCYDFADSSEQLDRDEIQGIPFPANERERQTIENDD